MRIGVYIDGFNLYYGARGICGRGTPGWRWLDLRGLATSLVSNHRNWPDAQVTRVVYCTARIDAGSNPPGARDQETYLSALAAVNSVDLIDVLGHEVDGAVLMTNDSDLRLPAEQARRHVPVAVINPSHSYLARELRGEPDSGAGRHWWMRLSAADLKDHQLPDPAGQFRKPEGW